MKCKRCGTDEFSPHAGSELCRHCWRDQTQADTLAELRQVSALLRRSIDAQESKTTIRGLSAQPTYSSPDDYELANAVLDQMDVDGARKFIPEARGTVRCFPSLNQMMAWIHRARVRISTKSRYQDQKLYTLAELIEKVTKE